jgi:uncharacterized protein (TIGR03437 family)
MIQPSRFLVCAIVLCLAPALWGQVTLNPNPATVLGHPQLTLRTANPNLVEGREMYGPSAVAIDTTVTPPILYVADTANNRVLAWRNASQFSNGAFADMVIGQKDLFSTFPQGPGGELTGGLSAPTGLAVDATGNLFVADAGNNRILRYSRPFADSQQVKLPDLVIGQASLSARSANSDPETGTISARTLRLNTGSAAYLVGLLFDPAGNLFVADAGNNRVLRYKAADVAGTTNGPAADLLLGQATFTSTVQNPSSTSDLTRLGTPAGMAMDSAGRLYVCDAYHRVLVYLAPLSSGPAYRMIGGVPNTQGALQPPDARTLYSPNGVFVVGDRPYVVDTGNNRILRFPKFSDWPALISTPPAADDVIGQAGFSEYKANRASAQPVFGTPGQPAISFASPTIAVPAAGELFVMDTGNNRLVVSSDPATTTAANMATKRVLGQVQLDGDSANYVEGREFFFGGYGGLVVDTRSSPPHLYVADTINNRVLGFRDARVARPGYNADLVIGQPDFFRTVANYPNNSAIQPTSKSLYLPMGVAVDSTGNLYVADTGNGRVLRFPRPFDHGNYPEADLVLGKRDFVTSRDSTPDPTDQFMYSPYGLAFTQGGHLLVSDSAFHRVLLFRKPEGGDFTTAMHASGLIGQAGYNDRTSGNTLNKLNTPTGIGVDTSDRLFVCDTGNNRVLAFDSIGAAPLNPAAAFALTSGDKVGSLSKPQGIFVSPVTGETWVADTNKSYILRYPVFTTLVVSLKPDFYIPTGATTEVPLALTVDGFGNLLAALSTNRIGFYFAAATPVNTANGLTRLAPGMMASLYTMSTIEPALFGDQTTSATSLPLPKELADIQILVNDQPVPLLMVSPRQINFLMPMSAPTSGNIELQVVRKSLNQILAVGCAAAKLSSNPDRYACSGLLQMYVASPALFAGPPNYDKYTGQIAAYNVKASDGTSYGVNSAANPVARSDYIVLFGTGQGFVPNTPADGAPPGGVFWTSGAKPQVIVNRAFVGDENVTFSGLSPEYPGLWQLNVKIPDTTPPSTSTEGSTLLVVVHRGIPSNDPDRIVTTIQVKQ